MGPRTRLVLLLWVFMAFAIRAWQLDAQSLRGDEAFDVVFSRRPVPEILNELRTSQPYPPLYHLFLKGWMVLVGRSEFSLRFPSLWCSVLSAPLLYVLARRWCGERCALWAVFLWGWQPLAIWYAQDGRMYAALMLLPLASIALGARLWEGRRGLGLWIGYVLVTYLGVMTHYMAFLALFAQQLCALYVVWRDRDWRFLWQWSVAQSSLVAFCLPWVVFVWPLLRSHTSSWAQPASAIEMLWRVLRAYTVGLTLDWRYAVLPVAASTVTAVRGGVALWQSGKRHRLYFLFATIGVPVFLLALESLRRPAFDERYLVFLVAPILILVGHGLASLARKRWMQVSLAGLFLVGMWGSYAGYRFDPSYAKSRPWRELFDYLATRVQQGDAVVYTFPDPAPEVYTDDRWPIYILPASFPPSETDLSQRVAQLAADYERIWLIPQWSPAWDEEGLVEDVLDRACERVAEISTGSWPLVVYHTPVSYMREIQPLDAVLEGHVRLVGYALRDELGTAVEDLNVAPGGMLRLTLYWRADSKIEDDYVVFVHVLDPTGWLRGQRDNQPRQGTFPTRAWAPGELVVDPYLVPVATGGPPGEYTIEVGMYRVTDGVRLPTVGADADLKNRRVLIQGRVWVP